VRASRGRIGDDRGILGFGSVFCFGIVWRHLIHGFLLWDQNQGRRDDAPRGIRGASRPFSFIRTLTVGLGIAPNLLTLPSEVKEGARGLGLPPLPPVGNFTPP